MLSYAIVVVVAYWLGSVPFGLILVRIFRGVDVRGTGGGNIGAANVARLAPGLGALTLLLDAGKGYAAVCMARSLGGAAEIAIGRHDPGILLGIAGLASVLGHMFPVWLRFRGGKGVATAAGVYLGISPAAVLMVFLLFVIIFARWRYSSLASIICATVFPVVTFFTIAPEAHWHLLPFVVLISVLIMGKHRSNIKRLRVGHESRFGPSRN